MGGVSKQLLVQGVVLVVVGAQIKWVPVNRVPAHIHMVVGTGDIVVAWEVGVLLFVSSLAKEVLILTNFSVQSRLRP